ncbi:hypothetical protein DFH09DRAFT_1355468 [Mycena vulgaris]|nr:hypothetical protein DFH09DRAFT_1355468 [Mycena vulgaris]
MAALLVFKIIASYVILSVTFAALNEALNLPPFSLFLVALTLTPKCYNSSTPTMSFYETALLIFVVIITAHFSNSSITRRFNRQLGKINNLEEMVENVRRRLVDLDAYQRDQFDQLEIALDKITTRAAEFACRCSLTTSPRRNKHNRLYTKSMPIGEKLTKAIEDGKINPRDDYTNATRVGSSLNPDDHEILRCIRAVGNDLLRDPQLHGNPPD